MEMQEIVGEDVPRVAWRTVQLLAYFQNKVTPRVFANALECEERIAVHMMDKFVNECRRDFLVFIHRIDRSSQDRLICAIFEKGCYDRWYTASNNKIYVV